MPHRTVFISGANGFISQHICKQLLEAGYSVIGTVRSEEKGERLNLLLRSDKFDYEVIKDIGKEGAFDAALKKHPETSVFIHAAAPVTLVCTDVEKDILRPAIEGTLNALSAASDFGPNIEKVILTSSFGSMIDICKGRDSISMIDENSWNSITRQVLLTNGTMGYYGAKTFAERAAWKYMAENRPTYSLSLINPVYVFGPQAFDANVGETINVSAESVYQIVKAGPDTKLEKMDGTFIDVRDVAAAHLKVIDSENAAGQRLLLTTGPFNTHGLVEIIRKNFPKLQARLPKVSGANNIVPKGFPIDNKKTIGIIGAPKYDLELCIKDQISQILKVRGLQLQID